MIENLFTKELHQKTSHLHLVPTIMDEYSPKPILEAIAK